MSTFNLVPDSFASQVYVKSILEKWLKDLRISGKNW